MRLITLSALALGSALLVGCVQDAPTTPESLDSGEAVFSRANAPGGGGGGGGEEVLEWYIEFSDVVEDDQSLDIKIYHYASHGEKEASGSGTAQVSKEKIRLDVDFYDGDDTDVPYVTVDGVTNKGEDFTLTFLDEFDSTNDIAAEDDCAPEVKGAQKRAELTVTDTYTFCGNITS